MPVRFFTEDVDELKVPKQALAGWIKNCSAKYNHSIGDINLIFCSDEYLKEINIQYLKHNYYTDIITFNYNEDNIISGDIYISTERVLDNSVFYNVTFYDELYRVIIHGILHLNGFSDESIAQKSKMRLLEDECLKMLKSTL